MLYSIANLNTRQSGGLEFVFSSRQKSTWQYNLTGNIYYTEMDASNLGYSPRRSGITGNLKGYVTFKLWESTSFQFKAFYYFPNITPQGQRKQFWYCNGGIKQELLKKRASLIATLTDIFHTFKNEHSIGSAELDQISTIRRKQPVIYLGFIWRIKSYREKEELEFEGEGLVK